MQAFEEETKRALKKQRLCASQIDAQLDFLLEEAALAKQQLLKKQAEFRRKKSRPSADTLESAAVATPAEYGENAPVVAETTVQPADKRKDTADADTAPRNDNSQAEEQKQEEGDTGNDVLLHAAQEKQREEETGESGGDAEKIEGPADNQGEESRPKEGRIFAEEEDTEVDNILQGFIHRVRLLNVEKNVADELKAIHVALSKYAKQIDKVRRACYDSTISALNGVLFTLFAQTFCNDITKVCHSQQFDHKLVCRLVAEYLYQDGQIEAADSICKVCQDSFCRVPAC